ncbi:MAG: DUF2232 domain-containing protein [Candidatus Binataceae bacterium]
MTRKAIIGSIRAGLLSGAFFLAAAAIPLVGTVVTFFTPAPILIFAAGRTRAALRSAVTIAFATAMVAMGAAAAVVVHHLAVHGAATASTLAALQHAAGFAIMPAVIYLLTFGVLTGVMAWMIERQRPFELIVVTAGGVTLTVLAVVGLVAAGGPAALVRSMQTFLAAQLAQGQEFYRMLGMQSVVQPETQSEVADIVRLSPALIAMLIGLSALLNLRVFWRWVGKKRLPYPLFGDLARWSTPEWLIWGLIATGFGMLAPIAPVSDIAKNAFLCFAVIYFCQGLAIIGFYFQALSVPAIFRAVIYFVTIVHPVVSAVVCLAGVFDMWVDFRRLKPPSQEAGNYGDFL